MWYEWYHRDHSSTHSSAPLGFESLTLLGDFFLFRLDVFYSQFSLTKSRLSFYSTGFRLMNFVSSSGRHSIVDAFCAVFKLLVKKGPLYRLFPAPVYLIFVHKYCCHPSRWLLLVSMALPFQDVIAKIGMEVDNFCLNLCIKFDCVQHLSAVTGA